MYTKFVFYSIAVVKDLKYCDTHEWVKVDGTSAMVGITDHAQVLYSIGFVVLAQCFFLILIIRATWWQSANIFSYWVSCLHSKGQFAKFSYCIGIFFVVISIEQWSHLCYKTIKLCCYLPNFFYFKVFCKHFASFIIALNSMMLFIFRTT